MGMKYQCALCKDYCESEDDWTEEDAKNEFHENFPDDTLEGTDVVCNECYSFLMNGARVQ